MLALGATHAQGATGDATLSCPATVQPGQQFVAQLSIDAGTFALGAYSVTFTYTPAIATIASVAGGNAAEFSSSPTANPATFTSGTSIVSGLQSTRLDGPKNVVSVAMTSPTRSSRPK